MILNWTSSVNQNAIPNNISDPTYEDLMVYNVWNLYGQLTSSGWDVVSGSFYSTGSTVPGNVINPGYYIQDSAGNTGWNHISQIKFPNSMITASQTLTDVETAEGVYTPEEHPWVTLRKIDSNGTSSFLTIDCRYPLPPHKPNVSLVYDENTDYKSDLTNLSLPEKNVYVGPAVLKTNIVNTNIGNINLPVEEQEYDSFYGICFRDNANRIFSQYNIKGQTYVSETVAFIDIVIHKVQPIFNKTSGDFRSGTTKVRPKTDKNDTKSSYSCWGFDSIEPNTSISDTIIANQINKYKFHFHHVPGTNTFLYQLSTRDSKEGFDAIYGIMPINNASPQDDFQFTSLCINTDPGFKFKSFCINSFGGNKIKNIDDPLIRKESDFNLNLTGSVNNFYNTCFRNYNFSDGVVNIRYGNINKIKEPGKLPVFAPLEPKHSTYFSDKSSGLTSSLGNQTFSAFNATAAPNDNPPEAIKNEFSLKTLNSSYQPQTENKVTSIVKKNEYLYSYGKKNPASLNITQFFVFRGGVFVEAKKITIGDLIDVQGSTTTRKAKSFSITPENINFSDITGLSSEFSSKDDYGTYIVVSSAVSKAFPQFETSTKDFTKPNIANIKINNLPYNSSADIYVLIGKADVNFTYSSTKYYFGLAGATAPDASRTYSTSTTSTWVAPSTVNPAVPQTMTKLRDYFSNPTNNGTINTNIFIKIKIADLFDDANSSWTGFTSTYPSINLNGSKTDPQYKESQLKGTNAFSVFKSFSINGQTNLVATKYNFATNDDNGNIISPSVDVFETAIEKEKLDESDSAQIISMGRLKNSYDNSYSELPIFLLNADDTAPAMKGYLADIYWAPKVITNGSLVPNNDNRFQINGSKAQYQKIFWKGWWLPWIANDPADW